MSSSDSSERRVRDVNDDDDVIHGNRPFSPVSGREANKSPLDECMTQMKDALGHISANMQSLASNQSQMSNRLQSLTDTQAQVSAQVTANQLYGAVTFCGWAIAQTGRFRRLRGDDVFLT